MSNPLLGTIPPVEVRIAIAEKATRRAALSLGPILIGGYAAGSLSMTAIGIGL